MRKTNKLLAGLLSLCLAVSVSAMPALAAEDDASSTEATTYVVTFRPGEHGTFTDSFIAGLEKYGVLVLPRPLSRQQAAFALRLLRAGRQRMRRILEENQRLTKRLDDARVIGQAKCLLALHEQMTEAEAHRHIEKLAMDARVTRRQIAQSILRRYEGNE